MKTADLIPLILYELNSSDKYGLELTKNIEDRTNGQIVIKQPTLYTILKKLEKSKFITSYWLDSEIGGKRHYYKLTDNGLAQVSTLPSYDEIVRNILLEDSEEDVKSNSEPTEPKVSVLPTEEIFANNSIDTITNQEINEENAKLLSDNEKNDFAENKNVTTFIDNTPKVTINVNNSETKNEILDLSACSPNVKVDVSDIKFKEYVNLKNDKEYLKSKLYTKFRILSSFVLSLYLIAVISICLFALKIKTTKIEGFFMILASLIAIFYPAITVATKNEIRKNASKHLKHHSFLANIYLSIIIFFVFFIGLEIYNLFYLHLQFKEMLLYNNFSNFHAILLLVFGLIIHSIVYNLLKRKVRTTYDSNS